MGSTSYYNENRDALFEQYHSYDPATVHRAWAPRFLKDRKPGFACDIGAGSGRDANWLAAKGWEVFAVEPSRFREPGERRAHPRVTWFDDALPKLGKLRALGRRFDLILLCAVWMHVPQPAREPAFRILTELLNPSGLLVINLRLGRDEEENRSRGFHPISADELLGYARDRAVSLRFRDKLPDLRRGHIEWEWLVFEMPDDGTGSPPLLPATDATKLNKRARLSGCNPYPCQPPAIVFPTRMTILVRSFHGQLSRSRALPRFLP